MKRNTLRNPRLSLWFWLFFNPSGRISRPVYWWAIAFTFCLFFVFLLGGDAFIIENNRPYINPKSIHPLILFSYFVIQWTQLVLVAKRFQDHNMNGFFSLLTLLPYINIIVVIYVGLLESTPGPNRYGQVPDRPPGG